MCYVLENIKIRYSFTFILLQTWRPFIKFLLIFHVAFGINLFFIVRHYKLTLKYTLVQVRIHFLSEHLSSFIKVEDDTLANYIVAGVYVTFCIVKNVQQCYVALFLVMNIYGLAVVGRNFQKVCNNSNDAQRILMYYRSTCRLSRMYGKCFGWGLLLFVWSGVFSCTFWFVDTKEYSHFGTIGFTVFRLWWIFFNVAVTALGVTFMRMVSKTNTLYSNVLITFMF